MLIILSSSSSLSPEDGQKWTTVPQEQEPHTLCALISNLSFSVCTRVHSDWTAPSTYHLYFLTVSAQTVVMFPCLFFFFFTFVNRSVICRQVSVSKNMMCLFMVKFGSASVWLSLSCLSPTVCCAVSGVTSANSTCSLENTQLTHLRYSLQSQLYLHRSDDGICSILS